MMFGCSMLCSTATSSRSEATSSALRSGVFVMHFTATAVPLRPAKLVATTLTVYVVP